MLEIAAGRFERRAQILHGAAEFTFKGVRHDRPLGVDRGLSGNEDEVAPTDSGAVGLRRRERALCFRIIDVPGSIRHGGWLFRSSFFVLGSEGCSRSSWF